MAKITDPDSLVNQPTETDVAFDTTLLTIELKSTGNIDADDGITLQAVYSYCMEEWKASETLRAFPFPFEAIGTGEQFDLIDGWNWKNTATRELLRDGGFAVRSAAGQNSTEEWMCIVSLGDFEVPATHTAYFQQSTGGATTDTDRAGPVNQVIQIWQDTNADGTPDTDNTDYFKIFLREQGHIYDSYDLLTQQSLTALTYRVYKLPLSNRVDLNNTTADTSIAVAGSGAPDIAPYNDMDISYLVGTGFAAWANSTVYAANAVVSDSNRWYITALGGTSSGTGVGDDVGVTDWAAYSGEREMASGSGIYYAFNVIIDGNADALGSNPTKAQLYEFAKYMVRQSIDIDEVGTVTGDTANELVEFVGSTLKTTTGVYIDNYAAADINDLTMVDVGGTERTFPFTASLRINFSAQLVADTNAWYHVFFTNDDAPGDNLGYDFGTGNAITVDDATGTDMKGTVGGSAYVDHSFDYTGNVQRGSGSGGSDAPITVVAGGQGTASYVAATGTIAESTANSVSLVATQDRAYST